MLRPASGVNRLIRSGALGGVCILITVAGHGAADGHTSMLGIALLAVLMMFLAVFATARELTFSQLLAFAGISQVGAHVLLSFLSPMPNSHTAQAVSGPGVAGHHGGVGLPVGPAGATFELPLAMITVHAVLCVAMAALLHHGEQLYFRLHRTLPEVLRVLLGTAVARTVAALPVVTNCLSLRADDVRPPVLQLIAQQIARRGPPLPSV